MEGGRKEQGTCHKTRVFMAGPLCLAGPERRHPEEAARPT